MDGFTCPDKSNWNRTKNLHAKVFKTGAIFWEKAQCVCTAVKTLVPVTSVKIRSIIVQSEDIK